jgi:hypothetical protein
MIKSSANYENDKLPQTRATEVKPVSCLELARSHKVGCKMRHKTFLLIKLTWKDMVYSTIQGKSCNLSLDTTLGCASIVLNLLPN